MQQDIVPPQTTSWQRPRELPRIQMAAMVILVVLVLSTLACDASGGGHCDADPPAALSPKHRSSASVQSEWLLLAADECEAALGTIGSRWTDRQVAVMLGLCNRLRRRAGGPCL